MQPQSNEEAAPSKQSRHWLNIALTSFVLGSLTYAGLLFPFAVTDGLLGLDCHGWVKGSRGAASMLFILGWGCTIAVMAGRVFGRTESIEEIVVMLKGGPSAASSAEGDERAAAGGHADSPKTLDNGSAVES